MSIGASAIVIPRPPPKLRREPRKRPSAAPRPAAGAVRPGRSRQGKRPIRRWVKYGLRGTRDARVASRHRTLAEAIARVAYVCDAAGDVTGGVAGDGAGAVGAVGAGVAATGSTGKVTGVVVATVPWIWAF